jgi:hypothetical protein
MLVRGAMKRAKDESNMAACANVIRAVSDQRLGIANSDLFNFFVVIICSPAAFMVRNDIATFGVNT